MPTLAPVRRRVTGTAAQLRALLTRTHTADDLVSLTPPTSTDAGRTFTTFVELRQDQRHAAAVSGPRTGRRAWVVLALAVASLTATGWAVYAVGTWVRAHADLLIGIGAVALIVFAALAGPAARLCGCLLAGLTARD